MNGVTGAAVGDSNDFRLTARNPTDDAAPRLALEVVTAVMQTWRRLTVWVTKGEPLPNL